MKYLIIIAVTLTSATMSCSNKGQKQAKNEPLKEQTKEKPKDALLEATEMWTSPLELSKGQLIPVAQTGYSLHVFLGTAQAPEQRPEWNAQKNEGLLQFGVSFVQKSDGGENTGSGLPAFTCRTENYLFTKASQRGIGEDYENAEAEIYLKTNGGDIAVGKYRKHDGGDRFTTWIHPALCEGIYAPVCDTRLVSSPDLNSETLLKRRLSIEIYLKKEGTPLEKPSFVASTPIKTNQPNFKHFGCDY